MYKRALVTDLTLPLELVRENVPAVRDLEARLFCLPFGLRAVKVQHLNGELRIHLSLDPSETPENVIQPSGPEFGIGGHTNPDTGSRFLEGRLRF